jgi:hypothetical protein
MNWGPIQNVYGFIPNVFRAQADCPNVIEAEGRIRDALLIRCGAHPSAKRNVLATTSRDIYCSALHGTGLTQPERVSDSDAALLDFVTKLPAQPQSITANDIVRLPEAGFEDSHILEAIGTTAWGGLLCCLAEGLQPEIDAGLDAPGPGGGPAVK